MRCSTALATVLLLVACGGAEKPAERPRAPADEAADPAWQPDPVYEAETPASEPSSAPPPSGKKPPEFTEGMNVEQAIRAVPSDYDFVGIEQEVLSKPLRDPDFYAPCKLKPTDKFTLRIAVWDGRVVGADVKSKNSALATCIDGLVRKLEYKEKVESINTVEFSY